MSKAKKTASTAIDDSIGYAEAVGELEAILEELESDDVDVDALAEHVQRASQLIELCRDRIGKAKLRIEEVVTQLDNN
jgi:exodeoxyribonuclease VII small subunit